MFALLYGLYYLLESGQYENRSHVKKPNTDSIINIGIFDSDEMKDVSAIIFTNVLTLWKLSSLSKSAGYDPAYVLNVRYDSESPHYKIHEVGSDHPEDLLDGLYVFHNPNANIKFVCKELKSNGIVEFSLDSVGIAREGGRAPIVARYCYPMGYVMRDILMSTAASNYNRTIAYDVIKVD